MYDNVCMYTCMYVYICMYVCMYVRIYCNVCMFDVYLCMYVWLYLLGFGELGSQVDGQVSEGEVAELARHRHHRR